MQRVDKQVGATERNPSLDATVAEPGENVSFSSAGQTGLGQPCGRFAEEFFIHT